MRRLAWRWHVWRASRQTSLIRTRVLERSCGMEHEPVPQLDIPELRKLYRV